MDRETVGRVFNCRYMKGLKLAALLVAFALFAQTPDLKTTLGLMTALGALLANEWNDDAARRDFDPAKLDHDRLLFQRYHDLLPESRLHYVLATELCGHRVSTDICSAMYDVVYASEREEGRFLNKAILRLHREFVKSLMELYHFICTNFFTSRTGGVEMTWLYPDLKYGTEEQQRDYKQSAEELLALVDRVEPAFKKYRAAVKERLAV